MLNIRLTTYEGSNKCDRIYFERVRVTVIYSNMMNLLFI